MVEEAYQNAVEHGWEDKHQTFGDRLALVHSELSEALEAFRVLDRDSHDAIREPLYKGSSGGLVRYGKEYTQSDSDMTVTLLKPEGVWSELADVVIRVGHICGVYGIDLNRAIKEKMAYNRTRPYRHGNKRL